MNPQDVPGRVPDAHRAVDQVVNHAGEGLQAAQPVVMNIGDSDEIEEENVFMDDDNDSDFSSESDRAVLANTGLEESSNSSLSEELEDDENGSDDGSDDETFHYPSWNLTVLDHYGRPRKFYTHSMSTLKFLVARSRSRNSSYVFWYLLRAVFYGSMLMVSAMLAFGVDPNDPRARFTDGSTLLHVAAFRGHMAIVVLLLRHGARVDAICHSRCTPLHLAAIPGCLRTAVVLVSAGANVEAQDLFCHTPICYAIAYGRWKVYRALKAFCRVLGEKYERGRKAERGRRHRRDREDSSGQHFFTLFFPRPQ